MAEERGLVVDMQGYNDAKVKAQVRLSLLIQRIYFVTRYSVAMVVRFYLGKYVGM